MIARTGAQTAGRTNSRTGASAAKNGRSAGKTAATTAATTATIAATTAATITAAQVYYYSARGPEFRRGHHLPVDLRSPQYVVVQPQRHHLKAPPRGHQWVQVGADYVLVAVATGLIAHIVLSH